MKSLSLAAKLYIAVVCLAALALGAAAYAAHSSEIAGVPKPETLAFLAAAIIAEFLAVPLPRGGYLSVSTIPAIAIALLFSPPIAMAIAALAMIPQQIYAREPWYKLAFNTAASAIAVGLSSLVVGATTDGQIRTVLQGNSPTAFLAVALAGLLYYSVNKLMTHVVVALANQRSIWSVIIGNSRDILAPDAGMLLVGALLAFIWAVRPAWSLAIMVPTVVTYSTLKYMRRNKIETAAAVIAIADIVDSRDSDTYHHSRRVALYVEALAETMGLDSGIAELIVSAARVHDLGKIGIPDSILLKPGRLTATEMAVMRGHSAIGAEILGRFEQYQSGTALARHHHERYDGGGYPDGLRGEVIPLGARILCVADAYDAMTSDRPYRKALGVEEAINRLKMGQGTQFDPLVVAAMVQLATDEDSRVQPEPAGNEPVSSLVTPTLLAPSNIPDDVDHDEVTKLRERDRP